MSPPVLAFVHRKPIDQIEPMTNVPPLNSLTNKSIFFVECHTILRIFSVRIIVFGTILVVALGTVPVRFGGVSVEPPIYVLDQYEVEDSRHSSQLTQIVRDTPHLCRTLQLRPPCLVVDAASNVWIWSGGSKTQPLREDDYLKPLIFSELATVGGNKCIQGGEVRLGHGKRSE